MPVDTDDNVITLVLFPGLATNIVYNSGRALNSPAVPAVPAIPAGTNPVTPAVPAVDAIPAVNNYSILPLSETHGRWEHDKVTKLADTAGVITGNDLVARQPNLWTSTLRQNNNGSNVTKWRVVSSGLKVALLNNAHDNDGWFECARIQVSLGHEDYTRYDAATGLVADVPSNGENRFIAPILSRNANTNACSVFGVDSTKLTELSSYRTGKLRDIHKYNFTLANTASGGKHDWVKMTEAYPVVNGTGSFYSQFAGVDNSEFIEANRDPGMDVMIVRLHGRAGTATNLAPSRVLVHSVHNLEVVYESGSTLSRFHSEGLLARAALRASVGRLARSFTRSSRKSSFKRPRPASRSRAPVTRTPAPSYRGPVTRSRSAPGRRVTPRTASRGRGRPKGRFGGRR